MFSKPFKPPSGIKTRTALQASKLPGPSRNRPQGIMLGQYFWKQCEYNVKQLILGELNFQKQYCYIGKYMSVLSIFWRW